MKKFKSHIPNIISLSRLPLAGICGFCFIVMKYRLCTLCFLLSLATDMADGYVARKYNLVTDAGKLIDPLTDKFMLMTMLSVFASAGLMPLWMLTIEFIKDVIQCLGAMYLQRKGIIVEADLPGKLSTSVWTVAVSVTLVLIQTEVTVPAWIFRICLSVSVSALLFYAVKYLNKIKEEL